MKHLALIAIVVFGLSQQPTKPPEGKDDPAKGGGVQVADHASADKDNNKPTVQAPPAPDKEELKTQEDLARFTRALVIVSFLQFAALIVQACLFFRQARIMDQHRVHLERLAVAASDNAIAAKEGAEAANKNAEFSKLNAEATEKSADAAKASADAALLNAKAVINAERPWVMIQITETKGATSAVTNFQLNAFNYGKSPAHVVDCRGPKIEFYDSPAEQLPIPPNYGRGQWSKRFLAPRDSFPIGGPIDPSRHRIDIATQAIIEQREKRGIAEKRGAVLVVYGLIQYTDGVSNTTYTTTFCYGHQRQRLSEMGGHLFTCGPPIYNQYT